MLGEKLDVSTIGHVPLHRRWGLMLARLEHRAPYLTREETASLLDAGRTLTAAEIETAMETT